MTLLKGLDSSEIKRRILGSWELSSNEDYSETINLYGSPAKFIYTCSATSAKERIRQIFVGDEIYGNWHIRTARQKNSESSSSSGLIKDAVTLGTEWLAPRVRTGKVNTPVRFDENELGLFLVLNFTDIPESMFNVNLLGVRLDVANWLNNVREIVDDDYLKIISLTDNDTRLTLKDKRGTQVWRKFQESIGTQ